MKNALIALAITVLAALLMFLVLPDAAYLWVKSVHVFAVIAWMAGMLYLPRLFVYHADAEIGSVQSQTFKVMERRLLKGIMNPSMIATWVAGIWLAVSGGWLASGDVWIQLKILLVLAMSAIHGMLSAATRRFAEDRNERSARSWRMLNEVPAVLLIGIIILVVVKPF
ncbi:protoporphyrinogen oxidase HemJ [Jiella mangrovi]|uniref:Protoporphyrinogen IX oxidase n=1 Tax=Jiella mangrovi TaxID=2821407 RepID=A0ABS4BLS0_9HYPH|nr:protoporphyrinogen oxidase HemJ [Jiella mangrovi]MBP0617134.1 protoporphyrinogen oxidase HemJ [Jiella mangrovi]